MTCLLYRRWGGEARGIGLRRAPSKALTRADTPHGEPAVLVEAAGTQATSAVEQAVLAAAIARGSRPPVAVGAGIDERAIVVVPTIDRREGGALVSNTFKLV